MRGLLEFREHLRQFYGAYSIFINKAGQFLLAMIVFWSINKTLGYFEILNNPIIIVGLSLICMFLPTGFTVFAAAAFILGHLYSLSLEVMGVTAVIMLILFIFFYRFAPRYAAAVLLMPLLFGIKLPYVLPIALGLTGTPAAAAAIVCGTVAYYMVHYISTSYAATISTAADESVLTRIAAFVKNFIQNKEMFLVIVAFVAVLITVYVIRRLSIDHAWVIAIGIGLLMNFLIFVAGDVVFEIPVTYSSLIIGTAASLVVAVILTFFFFTVDYSSTKLVQYEDDDYYYYVKAVPKISVSPQEKQVKHIRHWREDRQGTEE